MSDERSTELTIGAVMVEANNNAKAHGWWDEPVRTFGDQIALMHSELSEALEEFRVFGERGYRALYQSSGGKPEGIASEFADVIIRICDTSRQLGIPLVEALQAKLEYNRSRPFKHGGKVI